MDGGSTSKSNIDNSGKITRTRPSQLILVIFSVFILSIAIIMKLQAIDAAALNAKSHKSAPEDGILVKNAFSDDGKKIAFLTFDDGPSKNVTPMILDILKRYHIKATFFMVGSMAKHYPDMVRRVASEGHAIGNHTYSHNYKYIYGSPSNLIEEVRRWEATLRGILGEYFKSSVFRFPGGSFGKKNQDHKDALKKAGYDYVNWNALSGDAEGRHVAVAKLISRLKSTVHGKDHVVILMHDLGSKDTTVEALPTIIEYLISEGYEFRKLK